ncbi:hypothetical protein BDZ97DRAFT_1080632 [Flammula alnicola]|nr:hypothetical protein BDZ97DRAFT_1080632 [Flammula alnicola]
MTPMYKYRASWMKIFSCAPSLVLCWSLNNFRSLSFKSPPNNHYYACLFSPYLGHCLFAAVSALTVPVKRSDVDSLDKGAKEHLTNLGLAKGSAERKEVKEYHRKIVAEEMAKNGAHSAQIVHLRTSKVLWTRKRRTLGANCALGAQAGICGPEAAHHCWILGQR